MHAGEYAELACPAFYAHGGAEIYSDFGSMKIPADSDLTYKLEVLNCEETVEALNRKNKEDKNGAPELAGTSSHDDDNGSGDGAEDDHDNDGKLDTDGTSSG